MINPMPRFTREGVIPEVYGDALSYYETLCKMGQKINEMIEEINNFVYEEPEKMQEYVNNWLALHPEATTTVEDNSLNWVKFTETLKLFTTGGFVIPQMYGAVGDGETDDTEAFAECFANNKCIVIPDGTYMIDVNYGIAPTSNSLIICSGNSVIKAITNALTDYAIFDIDNVSNVTIVNAHIVGDRETHTGNTGEWGHCVRIRKGYDITLFNCHIEQAWGDGVAIEPLDNTDSHTQVSDGVKIIDCHIEYCRRQGISLIGARNTTISNCEINNINGTAPMFAIDLETNYDDTPISNTSIQDCYMHDNYGGDVLVYRKHKNTVISNCKCNKIHNLSSEDELNCSIRSCFVDDIYVTSPTYVNDCEIVSIYVNTNDCIVNNCIIYGLKSGSTKYYIALHGNNNLIDGCKFVKNDEVGEIIRILTSAEDTVINNCSFDITTEAIFGGGKNLTFSNNRVNYELDDTVAYLFNCDGGSFINNIIDNVAEITDYIRCYASNDARKLNIIGNLIKGTAYTNLYHVYDTSANTNVNVINNNGTFEDFEKGSFSESSNIQTENNFVL